MIEYYFTSHQLIYGYAETDDDNDEEIDRNLDLHFKDKGAFYIPYHIAIVWDEQAFDIPVCQNTG